MVTVIVAAHFAYTQITDIGDYERTARGNS
jgi:hypothetical protein